MSGADWEDHAMATPGDPIDLDALAEPLRRLLAEIDAGRITSGALALSYLAGALAALEAAAAGRSVPPPPPT